MYLVDKPASLVLSELDGETGVWTGVGWVSVCESVCMCQAGVSIYRAHEWTSTIFGDGLLQLLPGQARSPLCVRMCCMSLCVCVRVCACQYQCQTK